MEESRKFKLEVSVVYDGENAMKMEDLAQFIAIQLRKTMKDQAQHYGLKMKKWNVNAVWESLSNAPSVPEGATNGQ